MARQASKCVCVWAKVIKRGSRDVMQAARLFEEAILRSSSLVTLTHRHADRQRQRHAKRGRRGSMLTRERETLWSLACHSTSQSVSLSLLLIPSARFVVVVKRSLPLDSCFSL